MALLDAQALRPQFTLNSTLTVADTPGRQPPAGAAIVNDRFVFAILLGQVGTEVRRRSEPIVKCTTGAVEDNAMV